MEIGLWWKGVIGYQRYMNIRKKKRNSSVLVTKCRGKRKSNEILFIKCSVQAIPEEKLVWVTLK